MRKYILMAIASLLIAVGGIYFYLSRPDVARLPEEALEGREPKFTEPRRQIIPTVVIAKPVGWAKDAAPAAAKGLKVNRFFAGLDHPRNLLLLPNGDVLVAETNSPPRKGGGFTGWVMGLLMGQAGANTPSANRIALLRDTNGDGIADAHHVLLKGLNSPQGMALVGDTLYVANTDSLVAYSYKEGDTQITAKPRKIANIPATAPNYHWGRDLVASADGSKLYVAVGSNSNIGENGIETEDNRADVLQVDLKKGEAIIYASGLRNPTALAWNPWNGDLWGVVNERDMLGSDLVPDYLTEVQFGAFYGWPWNYWGGYEDKRVEPGRPELREYTHRPDYGLGVHVAPVGMTFSTGATLGAPFDHGAFIGLHGSWNRKPAAGYKVVYVAFDAAGHPQGKPVDLLTGFLNGNGEAQGRPVDQVVLKDGSLLVSDDVGGIVWRVSNPAAPKPAPVAAQ
ncbi:MAG: sorbosone dehydrogenase family protein [Sphingobium sp.]|nr:sorbosone dehydrogenase family protein [Sphingobium sp.]